MKRAGEKRRMPPRVLFANPWWHAELVNSTAHHAAEHGWHLDLQTCLSGQLPERWDGDGIITALGGDLAALRRFLRRARCPAVSLNTNYPEIRIARVSQDDAVAGRMAAGHFLGRGFAFYAYYSHGSSVYTGGLRRAAFAETLAAAGHATIPLLWEEEGRRWADTWLNRERWLRRRLPRLPKPLAVFATNDQAAVEVIEACMAEGIDVPGEVAVLGMLDMVIFRESTTVPLSSIRVDFDTITRTACDLLARMMAGEPPPAEPILFPPTGVVARRSTDTLAARTPEVARAIRYLLDHYAEPIGVPEIARAAGLSKTVLYERFRADLGQSPGEALIRIRVERARRLLREGAAKVEAVAQACGFGDRVNLHRHFTKHVGMTPAAYRREARKQEVAP